MSGSVLCQEVCSVRKGFCQEGILSRRNFVRKEFCQAGILSGRDFVRKEFCQEGDLARKEFCQEGILSGRNFARKEFGQEGILSGRNFVRQEFCQEAGSARKRALPGRRVSFGVACVVYFLFLRARGESASGGAKGDGGESALELCVLSTFFFLGAGASQLLPFGLPNLV